MHLGRYHEAIQTLSNIQIGPKKVFKDKGGIGVVKAFQGKHIEAEEILNELLQNLDKERNPINSLYISIICAKIGRTEEALLFLERGLQAKLPGLIYITIDPTWECLTSHKSFQKILPEALKSITLNSKAEKYSKSYLCSDRVASIKRRLTHLMEVEKIYLENNLSLIDVANHVKESSIILSQIFNQHMGTNFYDYVNDYRLKEFTQKIKDDNLKDFTIIAIAGQCGFSSKSAFNSYVKKTTNQTPKQYLNSILELEHA